MFDRILTFLKELPSGEADKRKASGAEDPRVAAAALMYHVMDADGVRQDTEWERMKKILAEAYGLSGEALDKLVAAGGEADDEAVDLYAFTSVLKRHLDERGADRIHRPDVGDRLADGDLHELEDNTVWRIAELIGVDRRDRILAAAEGAAPRRRGSHRTIQRKTECRDWNGRDKNPGRAAPGTVERRTRRPSADRGGLRPGHQAAAARRRAAGNARTSCRRGGVRRADERQ